ncbi:MAG TPA: DegQ family serine endoprotease [Candidatus Methylomirabilis sp.]|nr:DegQ family serine endoprotease [Candidatus Methylomirabilis sp.]
MRNFPRLKAWLIILGILVAAGGVLALAAARTGAVAAPLWTESRQAPSSTSSPWIGVAKEDTSAVVNISTTQVVKNPMAFDNGGGSGPGDPFQEFFRHFFGDMPRSLRTHSLGSGFVIREDGYVVTNNHVVDSATDITVKLSDGRQFPAKLIGRDEKTDLALLKIDAKNLPVLSLGDSDKLAVGEPVMAIGNPFGLEGTVTTGIVSAKGRVIGEGPYDNFIQTDASINPGNSGGPLVNMAGQVVGINTAIFSQTGGSVGIGFAIPINEAKGVLPELQAKGHVTRGWLGVSIQTVTPELAKALHLEKDKGALVAQVMPNSPAANAGLKEGDVIVEYEGHAVTKSSDLPRLVASTPIGKSATVKVLRDNHPLTLTAQIAELSEPQTAATANPDREKLGIAVQSLTPALAQQLGVPDRSGVVVAGVKDGSPAAEAGVQPGDVIVQANRQPVKDVADFRKALAAQKPDEPTLLQIHRKDASLFVAVTAQG